MALNGIDEWSLAEIAPPSPAVLSALRRDVRRPFRPRSLRADGRASATGMRRLPFRLGTWTFVSARLTGAQAAHLDLAVLRRGGRRPLARGAGRASRERIRTRLLPAGAYELGVSARRAAGAYRALLALE